MGEGFYSGGSCRDNQEIERLEHLLGHERNLNNILSASSAHHFRMRNLFLSGCKRLMLNYLEACKHRCENACFAKYLCQLNMISRRENVYLKIQVENLQNTCAGWHESDQHLKQQYDELNKELENAKKRETWHLRALNNCSKFNQRNNKRADFFLNAFVSVMRKHLEIKRENKRLWEALKVTRLESRKELVKYRFGIVENEGGKIDEM